MDCSPPGSSVHRIFLARILEWVIIPFSRGSFHPGIKPKSPVFTGGFLTAEPPGKPQCSHILEILQIQFQATTIKRVIRMSQFPNACKTCVYTIQFSSVTQLCLTLYDPMDCSTPGFPIHHQLSGFTQTHVHWVGDANTPSHPLLSPSSPTFNLSQHQGVFPVSQFFSSGGQSTGVSASASLLPVNIQDWFPLEWTGWIPLQSKGLSRVFSNTTVQKHKFFGTQLSLQSNSHIHTWLLQKP